MLTIRPVSLNNLKSPSFRSEIYDNKESYENERRYFEDTRKDLDEIINDDYIPEGMKKPFKFARIVTNGVVDGLAVGWAAMAGASSFKKAANSKFAKNVGKTIKDLGKAAKPIAEDAAKIKDSFGRKSARAFINFKNSKFGQKIADLYNKFVQTKFGKATVEFTKAAAKKVIEIAKKVVSTIKSFTYDKVSKTTAATLGTGSGIAGAYATAREENPIKPEKLEDEE